MAANVDIDGVGRDDRVGQLDIGWVQDLTWATKQVITTEVT